jgi:hypothetical protein
LFAVTLKARVPLPVPEFVLRVIQESKLVAAHAHDEAAAMVSDPEPPVEENPEYDGDVFVTHPVPPPIDAVENELSE